MQPVQPVQVDDMLTVNQVGGLGYESPWGVLPTNWGSHPTGSNQLQRKPLVIHEKPMDLNLIF